MAVIEPAQGLVAAQALLADGGLPAEARAMATICLGVAQLSSGQGEAAGETAKQALALLDDPRVPAEVRTTGHTRIAPLVARTGRPDLALELVQASLSEAMRTKNAPEQLNALITIAHLRGNDFDDPEGALPFFEQALALDRKLGMPDTPQNITLRHDLAVTLAQIGKLEKASVLFDEVDAAAAKFPDMQGIRNRVGIHRAETARNEGDLQRAEALFRSVIERAREMGDASAEAGATDGLARVLLAKGQAEAAKPYAERALALAEDARMPSGHRSSLYLMADVATALGDTNAAAEYASRARELDRANSRDQTARQLARLQAEAERDLQPEQVVARQAAARNRMLRDLGLATLAIIALVSLALLIRTRRQKHRLAELSTIDPLTGLANRRAADGALQALTADGRPAALLLLDVDAFKSINDRFGHDIGDAALVEVARCLREACDADDVVARWGGEEFLVARGDTSRMAAFALAEHLRRQIERLRVDDGRGGTLPLTVSTGVSSLPVFPGDTPRWQDAIRVADRALYVAKRAGRNAWAGVWGLEAGNGVDVYSVLDNPQHALQQGWIEIGGNRPMDWSQVRPKATGGTRGGGGPVRQETAKRP
ncbi:hypothetical protein BEN78_09715 [Xanthomonas citri pv. mangiferaeindicae]|nr:hypothetical protein BEN78_09715 [Xanthomonas citri pv. mangiferaeindicae]